MLRKVLSCSEEAWFDLLQKVGVDLTVDQAFTLAFKDGCKWLYNDWMVIVLTGQIIEPVIAVSVVS